VNNLYFYFFRSALVVKELIVMNRIVRYLSLLFVTTSLFSDASGPADLEQVDIVRKSKELMLQHPSYKHVSSELAGRIMVTFCEELDPLKTYFLQEDVAEWVAPSDEKIYAVIGAFNTGNFSEFEKLFNKFRLAVDRRNKFEAQLDIDALPESGVLPLHDLQWASSEEDLYERLKLLRAMQLKSAEQLDKDLYATALQRIQKRRQFFEVQRVPNDDQVYRQTLATFIMKAFACALDSQTAFYSPAEAKNTLVGLQQRLFGIGVVMRDDLDGFTVIKIVEGGPADREGSLDVNDKIVAVNGEPVLGLDVMDVVEMVRGEAETPVSLKVMRPPPDEQGVRQPLCFEVKIKRGEVVMQESRYSSQTKRMKGGGVGVYLRLHSFYQDANTSAHADLAREFEKIQQNNRIKGVVLDLRCNPGGLLTQAVAVSGLFMDKGVVVSIKDEISGLGHIRNIMTRKMWDGPLIIMVNRGSASAAEIVAQTLQDWGRAIVVGDDRSFGKGSFQIFTLNIDGVTPPNPQGEYKVTRGRYYTVSGKSPQLVGVQSDIVIPGQLQFAEIGEKYTRFPLSADAIPAQYEDTFEDVSVLQRPLLSRLYDSAKQCRTDEWIKHLPVLRKYASERLASNQAYQLFLKKAREAADMEVSESMGESSKEPDYQLEETWNILEDLMKVSESESQREPAQAA